MTRDGGPSTHILGCPRFFFLKPLPQWDSVLSTERLESGGDRSLYFIFNVFLCLYLCQVSPYSFLLSHTPPPPA